MTNSYRGRVAPSPTGLLHLGHARTFFTAYQRSVAAAGMLVFRNEDLDPHRSRPNFEQAMFEDLRWLGIRWQEGPDVGGPFAPYAQSQRRDFYLAAWKQLLNSGAIYPCKCSRKDLERSAQAPHEGQQMEDDEPLYPGTCRPLPGHRVDPAVTPAGVHWRFRVPDGESIHFHDQYFGPQNFVAGRDFGDFLVWRRDDVPAYQLAVVVDDAAMRITEVVRGADLIKSTARQLLLYRALSLAPPEWYHCPLVTDASGQRLAKRHDALSLQALRQRGESPANILTAPQIPSAILRVSSETYPSPMSDFAQSVKQQADIVKVIGEYVRLKKAGAQNYSGLCPFHKEKSPSFSVHAVRQFYHCFGCGVSGDVFSFVGKIENVGFPEAIRIVAQKCGIPLPKREFNSPEEAREGRQRGKLLEVHEQATAWFEEQLRSSEGSIAREYLTARGLTPEAIAKFRIGYAPDNFNALRERLQGVADAETLRLSGLFSFKEQEDGSSGPLYSRFRKRITFPIANESGRVIAFTARALDSGDKAGPKYMNSPETPLYSKGQVLFNLDKAKQSIRQHDFVILVEGQMDCISVYLAGIQNVLATSGTAFTEHQVNLLKRFTGKVVVNFDPDTAGANAAEKSIVMLTEEGFEIKVVTLEDGLDPDRYIRERGAPAYIAALRAARRQQDYLIERARQLFPGHNAETKVKALNFLLPHIRRMPSRLTRDEFAADAAQKLGIDSAVLREELKQAAARRRDQIASPTAGVSQVERILLRAFCSEPNDPVLLALCASLDTDPHHFESLTITSALHGLRNRGAAQPLEAVPEGRIRALLAQILLDETEPVSQQEADFALENLRIRYLEGRQRTLRAAIAESERKGDWGLLATLTAEKLAIDRELRTIGAG